MLFAPPRSASAFPPTTTMTTLTLSPPPPPSAPSQEPQALSEDAQAIFEILAIDVSDFESLIVAEQLQIEETLAFSLSAEVASSSSFSSLEEIDAAVVEEARKEAYVVDMAQLQEDLLLALSLTKDDAQLEADGELDLPFSFSLLLLDVQANFFCSAFSQLPSPETSETLSFLLKSHWIGWSLNRSRQESVSPTLPSLPLSSPRLHSSSPPY